VAVHPPSTRVAFFSRWNRIGILTSFVACCCVHFYSRSIIFADSCDASPEIPLEIHCSSSDLSSKLGQPKNVSIGSLLIDQNWEAALSMAEEKPGVANEWFYGVGDDLDPAIDDIHSQQGEDCVVWKRLALHMCCRYRAPVGLVEVLLEALPQAVTSPDPNCGSLPIHLACAHKSSFRVIKLLLLHAPTTTKAVDMHGRLPLHYAVTAKAHFAIIELLLEADPTSALAVDADKKTPLHLAEEAYGNKNAVVTLLSVVTSVLQKGADTVIF